MPKRLSYIVVMISAFALLSAMGGGGGGFERAPRVEKNFAVSITDVSGNTIEGEKFSWEGRTSFFGYIGAAQVVIPFEKIRDVTIGEKKDHRVRVTAHLRDGGEAAFDADANSRCYGEAKFGSFMLMMDEIKSITFK